MAKTSTLIVVIIALAVVAAAAYFLTTGGPSDTTQPSDEMISITIKLTETSNEAKVWVPSTVYLKKGDKIELTVVNGDDDDIHRLSIPDLGVETKDIPGANERDVVTFTVDKVGTFIFIDPLAPDWDSPECQAEKEGEEEAKAELEELVEELDGLVHNLEEAATMDEVATIVSNLEVVAHALEETAREDIAKLVVELDGLVHELEEANSLDDVSAVLGELEEVVHELEELAEELVCVPPGQIIVEP